MKQHKPPSHDQIPSFTLSRQQKVIINRLRIGHTHNWPINTSWAEFWNLTNVPHMEKYCSHAVKHIICYCQIYTDIRSNLQIADNLHEALDPDPANMEKVLKYLKSTNLYNLTWYCINSKHVNPFFLCFYNQ